jgi:hypothetical protein|tara:strand:+ start:1078 stop:1428 length:351 start_codon:yes stop_codon:yes gene_type:complete
MICVNCNKPFEKKENEGVIGRLRKYCSVKCRSQNYNRVYRERNRSNEPLPSSRNISKIINGDFSKGITVDNDWFFSTKLEDWCSSRESKSRAKYKRVKEQRLKEERLKEENEKNEE